MRPVGPWLFAGVIALASATSAPAARPQPLAPPAIQQFGGWFADDYDRQFKDRPIKFPVDVDNGAGFYEGGDGVIALPAKDLTEEAVTKAAGSPAGAPLCRISLSQRYQCLADGKPVNPIKGYERRSA